MNGEMKPGMGMGGGMEKKMTAPLIVIILVALGVAGYVVSILLSKSEVNEPSPFAQRVGEEKAEPADDGQPKEVTRNENAPSSATLLASGEFIGKAHDVRGEAQLIQTSSGTVLRFEDYETVPGPDLKIYLSSGLDVSDAVLLGDIRATKGSVNYTVPAGTDTKKYDKVLVWCQSVSVLFNYADLK